MFRKLTSVCKLSSFPVIIRSIRSFSESKISKKNSLGIISKEDASEFSAFFPKIVEDVVDQKLISSVPEVNKRITKLLNFNFTQGSHVASHLFLNCYKFLETYNGTFDAHKKNVAFKMAWCVEIMSGMALIIDDILDHAEERRGEKTWYKLEGPQALCDAFLLRSGSLLLLEKYFSHKENYDQIRSTIITTELDAAIGETLQFELNCIESFTIENFRKIAKYKTTAMAFYAPIKLACLLSNQNINLDDSNSYSVLNELGILYQIQNDFKDCFRENSLVEVRNDIQNNICTILIAMAMKKGSVEQRKTLLDCYGNHEAEKVNMVKAIYKELDLENEYGKYKEKSRSLIFREFSEIQDDLTRKLLQHYASLIFSQFKNEMFCVI
ncbi:hypothetical protein WA026_008534 [Henosepilachna vigintioctopunctata]|uniref:Farnesyl pyrophosphate synthase n=1 Tax=Henosepilachna vigintioctopunctata TaxID=420089 RepID=A0AAW1UKU9_9CUCU